MKTLKHKLIVFLFVLPVTFSCNFEYSKHNVSGMDYLNVCDVTEHFSDYSEKSVMLRGKLKGYHQLVLFSDNCQEDKQLILLSFDETTYLSLLEQSRATRNTRKSNELTGDIWLRGEVSPSKGTILNYGEFIQDIKSQEILRRPRDINVVELKDIKVDHFNP